MGIFGLNGSRTVVCMVQEHQVCWSWVGYSNTSESQENDIKSNLLNMIVAFKEETNKSLKNIQGIKLCET